ncbi:hypothetical protein ACROYT_G022533 [Oculina patagonica]
MYFLEGDGPLVFSCYEKLKAVAEACQAPHFPNVRAVVAAITNEDPNQSAAALEQRAKACVQPAIQWFLRKFNVDLYDAVTAFKAARVMCPVTVGWLRPTRASVEALRIFPFLDNDRQSTVLSESCHSTSLLLRMWLLNARGKKLSGGRYTKRGFLIGLLQSRKSYLFNLLEAHPPKELGETLHQELDETIQPVQRLPIQIPETPCKPLKEHLAELEPQVVIEKVLKATNWVNAKEVNKKSSRKVPLNNALKQ